LKVTFDKGVYTSEGEVRQFTLTNLNSYGAGMVLYDAQVLREIVSPNDWKLEVFALEGPFSVIGMTLAKKLMGIPCGSIPIVKQTGRVEMVLRRGEYFQMDGEPWVLNVGCNAIIEPNRKVRMLCPLDQEGPGLGCWLGKQKRSFWEAQMSSNDGALLPLEVELPEKARSSRA